MILCPLTFEPKINRLRHSVKNYYCAKFQVIAIRGFCFIELTYCDGQGCDPDAP